MLVFYLSISYASFLYAFWSIILFSYGEKWFFIKQCLYDVTLELPLYYTSILAGSFMAYSLSYLICKYNIIKKSRLYLRLNRNSFGIYLYSNPLKYLIMYLFVGLFSVDFLGSEVGAFVIFLFRFIGTIVIAVGITELLRKLGIKYIS